MKNGPIAISPEAWGLGNTRSKEPKTQTLHLAVLERAGSRPSQQPSAPFPGKLVSVRHARSDLLRNNILQRENCIPQHPNSLSGGQPSVLLIWERRAKVPRVEQPFLFTSLFFCGPIMVALRCRCAAGVLCLENSKILLPPPLVLFIIWELLNSMLLQAINEEI